MVGWSMLVASHPMTPAEALRAVCDAWERGDPDAAANLFAPDGVYEDPLYEAPLHGLDRLVGRALRRGRDPAASRGLRPGDHPLRHGRHLWRGPWRDAGRPRARPRPRPDHDRDQVRVRHLLAVGAQGPRRAAARL